MDIFANAGFLQVELAGDAHVTAPGSDPMLEVDLKDKGDLNFGEVVDLLLSNPGDLLDFDVNVGANGSVDVSVPGTTDFLGGGSATATFTWNDLNQTSGPDGPQFDVTDLSEFLEFDFDPTNPKALYSVILKTLQVLSTSLADTDPGGAAAIFSEPIPVVGRSFRDLLRTDESGSGAGVTYGSDTLTDTGKTFDSSLAGRTIVVGTQVGLIESVGGDTLTMASPWTTTPVAGAAYVVRSELDDAISYLQAAPPDNLQALVRMLDERLTGTPLDFEYEDGAVIMHLDWTRSYHTSAPVELQLRPERHRLRRRRPLQQRLRRADRRWPHPDRHRHPAAVRPGRVGPGGCHRAADPRRLQHRRQPRHQHDRRQLHVDHRPAEARARRPDRQRQGDGQGQLLGRPGQELTGRHAHVVLAVRRRRGGTLNDSSSAVDCGLPDASTDLALCAHFPLYISTDGGSSYSKLIDPEVERVRHPAAQERARTWPITSTCPVTRSTATTASRRLTARRWRRPSPPTSSTSPS